MILFSECRESAITTTDHWFLQLLVSKGAIMVVPVSKINQHEKLLNELGSSQPEVFQHALGVNRIALLIASELGIDSAKDFRYLHWGTLLHDVNKIDISQEILYKKGSLSPAEMEKMKHHVEENARFETLPTEVKEIILYHHERYDGGGYIRGLQGDEIPLLARICSVADAYDAMAYPRPYNNKMSISDVIAEITSNKWRQFDPAIVDVFLQISEGSSVTLYA